jgi:hypothetical protein
MRLDVLCHVVIHNRSNRPNVKTPGGDISGHKDMQLAMLERTEHGHSAVLIQVSMHALCLKA